MKNKHFNIGGFNLNADIKLDTVHTMQYMSFVCKSGETYDYEINTKPYEAELSCDDPKQEMTIIPDGYRIKIRNDNFVNVSKDYKTWNILVKENKMDDIVYHELKTIFAYSVLPYGGIVFHGVIMEWNGMGVIISAVSGGGKTTHARLWRDYENALIINGDRSLCRKIDGRWYAFGQPWCGTSGECVNRKVPIKAFVMIKKNSENSIKQIEPYNAALNLAQRVFAPRGNKELMNYTFDYIDDIVENIPVYELQCTPDVNAVETLKKVLITL